ncbi:4Fe-4S binding protein [Dyella halodurans]|uniref:4Fe-4S binding protein n=1 Tax=Dyella halodurans TaxID=1920171 RepID=A0ABV9C3B8_9GAMM|nr:4Fe-4S binding protein [Dyella halodurans]
MSLLLVGLWLWLGTGEVWAGSYEAELPAALFASPDLCQYAPCGSVLPQAERFSLRKGQPPYVEGLRRHDGRDEVVGYVFLSTDTTPDVVGYSGKPIVTLVGMDAQGRIAGVRILRHSEPILLAGIPETKLADYVAQYVGKPAGAHFELGRADGSNVPMVAISGATVTVLAENQMVGRGSYAVARQVGLVHAVQRPQARFTDASAPRDWSGLVAEGNVGHLKVTPEQVGEARSDQPFIELWFGYLNAPAVGKSVLGEDGYRRLMADLKPGEHAIFIIGSGSSSFKGSAFVRGGVYDRIQVTQDEDTYQFSDADYRNLYRIDIAGAPDYAESGIFILRSASFSAAYPWRLAFLSKHSGDHGSADFANFNAPYWLPARYLLGGRPTIETPVPGWVKLWKAKAGVIAAFVALLVFVAVFYALHLRWAARSRRHDKRRILWPHMMAWVVAVVFVGAAQLAQPSVVQVLTLIHAPFDGWRWDLFLSDPLIFLFWVFIAITIALWGRGVFCGWLCPYGSLSELLFRGARRAGLGRWQFALPARWHHRLRWLKYVVLLVLVAASFHSMALAERLAEVEPFKTTFMVHVWNRSWPFVLFWSALVAASLFVERPFCKYLCPLGAALALPSRFRLFGLRRKAECTSCKACAVGCGAQAIDARGRIDPTECMQCLDCMVLYHDDHACPPLSAERKRRAKAGLPLTPVGRDGHFIPIKLIE